MRTSRLLELLKAAGPRICRCTDPMCGQWHQAEGFPAYRFVTVVSADRSDTAGWDAGFSPVSHPTQPTPGCRLCGGTGVVHSGDPDPWGAGDADCPCTARNN